MKSTYPVVLTAVAFGFYAAAQETTPQEANGYLAQSLSAYQSGADFSLSFTLLSQQAGVYDSSAVAVLTLGKSYYLIIKPRSGFALSSSSASASDSLGSSLSSWSLPASTLENGSNRDTTSAPELFYGHLVKTSSGSSSFFSS